MKSIDWNEASKLGLIEKINKEILHPLGLAMCRVPETGTSPNILVAPDGEFQYDPEMKSGVKSNEFIKQYIKDNYL